MRLNLQDLVVASFETGAVCYSDLTVVTIDTAPTASVTACYRCPPDTKNC